MTLRIAYISPAAKKMAKQKKSKGPMSLANDPVFIEKLKNQWITNFNNRERKKIEAEQRTESLAKILRENHAKRERKKIEKALKRPKT